MWIGSHCKDVKIRVNVWTVPAGPIKRGHCGEVAICRDVKIRVNVWAVHQDQRKEAGVERWTVVEVLLHFQ